METAAGRSRPKTFSRWLAAGAGLTALLTLVGCAGAAPPTIPESTRPATVATVPEPAASADSPALSEPAEDLAAEAPAYPPVAGGTEVMPILATVSLNPGVQRVAFLLAGSKGIIKIPEASVSATYLGPETDGPAPQETRAVYHDWPYGIRGSYSAELSFDRPGPWQLDVAVAEGDFSGQAIIELQVQAESPVPALGERPPLSRTKTLTEVAGLEQLTTDYTPDSDLYRLSVAEAVASPRPAVIVFASPAFCTSPTCGPQVDTVKELKDAYRDRTDFVHVEIYDAPDEIQGDLSRAGLVDAVTEWGLSSLPHWLNESWVFILDDTGIVRQRFEGYATYTELEATLKSLLEAG